MSTLYKNAFSYSRILGLCGCLIISLLLLGCDTIETLSIDELVELDSTQWRWISFDVAGVPQQIEYAPNGSGPLESRYLLLFWPLEGIKREGRVQGALDCNAWVAHYRYGEGGYLLIDNGNTTALGCQTRMELLYREALAAATHYAVRNDTLSIFSRGSAYGSDNQPMILYFVRYTFPENP